MTTITDRPNGRCPSCGRRYDLEPGRLVLRMHQLGRTGQTCPGSGLAPKGSVR